MEEQQQAVKSAWIKPRIDEHGSLEELTQAVSTGGPGDGLFADGPS